MMVGKSHTTQALENLKHLTRNMLKLIIRQCELHASQKFRQSLQLYSVYSRMWGEEVSSN